MAHLCHFCSLSFVHRFQWTEGSASGVLGANVPVYAVPVRKKGTDYVVNRTQGTEANRVKGTTSKQGCVEDLRAPDKVSPM